VDKERLKFSLWYFAITMVIVHRATLNAFARLLLQTEVVDRAALDALLAESAPAAMKSVAPAPDPLPLTSAG
jgi:hypothetical protein